MEAGSRDYEHAANEPLHLLFRTLRPNTSTVERIASTVTGAALVGWGLSSRTRAGAAGALAGAAFLFRGLTGHCYLYDALGINTAKANENTSVAYNRGYRIEQSVVVDRPAAEIYRFWRRFENLPQFMKHLESVTEIDASRSHWVAHAPAGMTVSWDAEIVNEVPNELIGWRSLERADVDHAGSVRFTELGDGATEVRVLLRYDPPGGVVGKTVARLFDDDPSDQIAEDLRRLKGIMEIGGTPTV